MGREPITSNRPLPTFAGRSIGIVILVSIQSLVGAIHVFFGLWLFSVSTTNYLYSMYTAVFGLATLLFTFGFWKGKSWGWLGTLTTLLFVTVIDALTLLNFPIIPGVPKFAASTEIVYSIIFSLCLFQPHISAKARQSRSATELQKS